MIAPCYPFIGTYWLYPSTMWPPSKVSCNCSMRHMEDQLGGVVRHCVPANRVLRGFTIYSAFVDTAHAQWRCTARLDDVISAYMSIGWLQMGHAYIGTLARWLIESHILGALLHRQAACSWGISLAKVFYFAALSLVLFLLLLQYGLNNTSFYS